MRHLRRNQGPPQGRAATSVLGLIAVAALAAAGPARAAPAACKLHELLHLPVTMVGTRPTVPVKINGQESRFLVNTGAFFSIITPEAATRLHLSVKADWRLQEGISGTGGRAEAKATNVADFTLAEVPFHNVDLVVANGLEDGIDGLIGENILRNADVEYDLANGVVRLFKPEHCESQVLAYWNPSGASSLDLIVNDSDFSHHLRAIGNLNGQKIRLMFDTGASRSIITLKAAASVGVTPQTPGAIYIGQGHGIGSRLPDTWSVRFNNLKLDREEIQHTRLRIGGIELDDADMLIGADFFLSHRVLVSNSQGRLYFTYGGGPVFQMEEAARTPTTATAAAAPSDPAEDNAPTDAAGFARRGAAFLARYDYPHAIADFTRAHELDPTALEPVLDRARARMALGQTVLAMADLDDAVKLKPDDVDARLLRAALYHRAGDGARARSDLQAATQATGGDAAAGLRVALSAMGNGFPDDSLPLLDHWIAANPNSQDRATALNGRCYARAQLHKDLDAAVADCNAALKLAPRNPGILDSRGFAHLAHGDLDAAIADYDAALAIQPKLAIALYGRGVAKLKKGQKDAGDADIQAALKIAPKIEGRAKEIGLTL
jgi:tetratricopeptide (TPR) repeat protein/predicted aspartyl protease